MVTSVVVRRSGELAAALVCVILAGCSFPADYAGTRYQCEPGDECPPGFSCVAGYCESGGPPAGDGGGSGADGGDGASDAGQSDAGGADADPPACPSVSRFKDDFSSEASWVIEDGASCEIAFVVGQVRMTGTLGRCIARTASQHALDARVSIEAINPEDGLVKAGFGVSLGDVSIALLRVVGGLDLVELEDGSGQRVVDSFPFDQMEQRFWSFRPVADGILFETSPDGIDWTELGEYRPVVLPECVALELDAIGTGNPAPYAAFDNLNLLPE